MGQYLNKIRQHERMQPIETVKAEEVLRQQQKALDPIPTIQPGDRIEWQRADLTVQHGIVDYLHTDADGQQWAFVSIGETWTAVNVTCAKGSHA
jgi:plastocyanin